MELREERNRKIFEAIMTKNFPQINVKTLNHKSRKFTEHKG